MEYILGAMFLVFTIGGGGTVIYGTWRNWPWLVNPPEELVFTYSLSFIKRVFGSAALRFHNYALGIAFVLAGLLAVWIEFFRK
jgi:hypothetical protein